MQTLYSQTRAKGLSEPPPNVIYPANLCQINTYVESIRNRVTRAARECYVGRMSDYVGEMSADAEGNNYAIKPI
jgi:hypothetical protein